MDEEDKLAKLIAEADMRDEETEHPVCDIDDEECLTCGS